MEEYRLMSTAHRSKGHTSHPMQLAGMGRHRQEYAICSLKLHLTVGPSFQRMDYGCPQTVAFWECWDTTSSKGGKKEKEETEDPDSSSSGASNDDDIKLEGINGNLLDLPPERGLFLGTCWGWVPYK